MSGILTSLDKSLFPIWLRRKILVIIERGRRCLRVQAYSDNKEYRDNKVNTLSLAEERTLTSLCKEAEDKGIGIKSLITTPIPHNYYGIKAMFKAIGYTVSKEVFFKA